MKWFESKRWFYLPAIAYIILGLVLHFDFGKGNFVIYFHETVKSELNHQIFQYFTWYGEGLVLIIIAIILGLKKLHNGLSMLMAFALSGGIAQLIKNIFGWTRPVHSNEAIQKLAAHVDWKVHALNSFPSGHTTTAFTISTLLILLFPFTKKQQLAFAFLAVFTGLSRVYLLQHFLIDTVAGASLGILSGTTIYFIQSRIFNNPNKWYNKCWI